MSDLRHILLGAGVFLLSVWGICGCNLPPLPSGPDVGSVCEPGQPNRCVSGGLQRCNQQGSGYEVTECGTSERCSNGACQPIQNECESDLPFSLSGADMASGPRGNLALRIESSDDLPEVSESLTLENCGVSPITVEAARIQGAHPAHQYEPWSIADGDSLTGTVVDPKESLRLDITHSPRFGFSVEPAIFHLKVDAGWTQEFDIELQPNVSCLTVPPTIDAGTLKVDADSPTRVEIPIQNCGNVDRQIRLPSPKGHKGLDLTWADQTPGTEGAIRGYDEVSVPAGGLKTLSLDVSKVETGYREVPLTFRVVERAGGREIEDPTTRLEVQADELNCDSGFGQPTVHLRRSPDSEASGVSDWGEQLEGTVEPFQPVDMHVETHHDVRVKLVEAPRGSAAEISSKEAEDHWSIVPDVVGTYRIVVWPYDDYGAKGCSEREIQIEVAPKAELHAELTWETAGDSIPGDRGYGRGVDLNLHALSYLPPKQLSGWHKPGDCAARGWNAARDRDCLYGELESTSVSGVGPEVVSFEHVDAAMAFVARVWHPYGFDAAGATFRLWANGELISETPVSRVLDGGMGTVWHIGAWSRTDQRFYLADEVRQNYPKEARPD